MDVDFVCLPISDQHEEEVAKIIRRKEEKKKEGRWERRLVIHATTGEVLEGERGRAEEGGYLNQD